MQVLLKKSSEPHDIQCNVCNQGFRVYWERTSAAEREKMLAEVQEELSQHHIGDQTHNAHPSQLFNLPEWSGAPQFSGAALLGGLSGLRRTIPSTRTSF